MEKQPAALDAVDELMDDPVVQKALRMIIVAALERGIDIAQHIISKVHEDMRNESLGE
jgi:uncharacterized protein YutE (UPF0331/DUF86 family)